MHRIIPEIENDKLKQKNMFYPSQHRLRGLRVVHVRELNIRALPSTNIKNLLFTVSEMAQPRTVTVVSFHMIMVLECFQTV